MHLLGSDSSGGRHLRQTEAAQSRGTFVLVHGAWHGGWCWRKVAANLRDRGHTVLTPTLTGLGERSHLMSESITIETCIDDIANLMKWEDLSDVVLVGHSFGGIMVSGVADRLPERVRQLIYLDAVMLEDGRSSLSLSPKEVAEARVEAARVSSGGLSLPAPKASAFGVTDDEQARWLESRLTPHPFRTLTSPMRLAHPLGNGLPAGYILCTDPLYQPLEASHAWVRAAGWKVIEFETGHDAMVTKPDELSELFITLSR